MYTVMYIPAPLYSIIVIGHVYSNYLLLEEPHGGGEGVSSQRRRADLSCTCPLSGGAEEARNRNSETGNRLHNEAWSAAAPSSVLAAREFLLTFGERASELFQALG
ncbi:unnamed protein product, partial [Staurois parvus]